MAQPKVRAAAVMGASLTKRAPTDALFILPPSSATLAIAVPCRMIAR